MKLHRIVAGAAAAALLVPAGVAAKGKPEDAGSKGKAKGKSKPATFVFKGTWTEADSTVAVTGGNSRVRKGGFKGTNVTFDFTNAKVKVADVNADGVANADDFADGDKLVIQAKLPRGTEPGSDALAARKAVDQTNPPVEESETPEAEPTPESTPTS